MKLLVSFTRRDTGEKVSVTMDKPDRDFVARHQTGKYALHMNSLQVYERTGNIICGKPIEVTGLTIRV